MMRLLITGVSGFLGWNICQLAKGRWQVFGTVFSHTLEIDGVNIIRIDLRDLKELRRLFKEIRPQAVIHTAGVTSPNFCQLHRMEAQRINVDASINIACLCADYSIPCVFTSTDIVFDGMNPPYKEDDPVCPINFYGEQKVMAERGMLRYYPDITICRMPLMFGVAPPTSSSFIQPMIKAMREGEEIRLFIDEIRTPISGWTAAEGILLALERVKGVIHLGGIERISRYEFGRLLSDVMDIKDAKLIPCRQSDIPMPAPRPPDVSLDSSKAFSLGFKPLPLIEELQRIMPLLTDL
ncbi:MAG: SDR family oxidoreductase [Thermodesulfovibrionia bacterium]